eukprot:2762302-Lingulodinium_polyedra.AAC.3
MNRAWAETDVAVRWGSKNGGSRMHGSLEAGREEALRQKPLEPPTDALMGEVLGCGAVDALNAPGVVDEGDKQEEAVPVGCRDAVTKRAVAQRHPLLVVGPLHPPSAVGGQDALVGAELLVGQLAVAAGLPGHRHLGVQDRGRRAVRRQVGLGGQLEAQVDCLHLPLGLLLALLGLPLALALFALLAPGRVCGRCLHGWRRRKGGHGDLGQPALEEPVVPSAPAAVVAPDLDEAKADDHLTLATHAVSLPIVETERCDLHGPVDLVGVSRMACLTWFAWSKAAKKKGPPGSHALALFKRRRRLGAVGAHAVGHPLEESHGKLPLLRVAPDIQRVAVRGTGHGHPLLHPPSRHQGVCQATAVR